MVTPFMQMHEAVRKLYKEVVKGILSSTGAQLVADVAQALKEEGLGEHGYFDHYRDFAVAMIEFFASTRKGLQPQVPQALHVSYGAEEIVVTPDDVLIAGDGQITLRKVSMGHSRSDDAKSIGAAAFLTAAAEAFPGATVELVYLADQTSYAPVADGRCDRNAKVPYGVSPAVHPRRRVSGPTFSLQLPELPCAVYLRPGAFGLAQRSATNQSLAARCASWNSTNGYSIGHIAPPQTGEVLVRITHTGVSSSSR